MKTKLEKEVRLLKVYAALTTLLTGIFVLTAFTLQSRKQNFEEITAKRIVIVDSNGKSRVLMGADLKGANLGGLLFFNEEGTEAGGLLYNGKRDGHGNIDAGALLTMDLFKSDEVIRLGYDHTGDQKRQGLVISDRPDALSPQAEELLKALGTALQSAKSEAERQALRRDYLSRMPAREIVARRLFAGRDVEGSSLVTLSDPDGKPRLRFQVDKLGRASITFLDQSGRAVRTIKPSYEFRVRIHIRQTSTTRATRYPTSRLKNSHWAPGTHMRMKSQ
jgi:hypothetical protein